MVMPDPDTMVFNVADILSFVIYEVHGTHVMLLDNMGLRIMASESTKSKSMLDMIFSIFLL